MTRLSTARLVLRRATWSDLDAVHDMLSRPEAMRYWSRPAHETVQETRDWLERLIDRDTGGSDDFLITRQGKVIGKAGMWRLGEVGFMIHPDHWRQGLAREAMQAVIPHIFAQHPVDHLTAEADPRNAASIGLLTRLGFAETHRAANTLLWGVEWCDSVYFQLNRADWNPTSE